MCLSANFNWPGVTICVSIVSAAWYFVEKEIQHRRSLRFGVAITKIYSAIERFISAANDVRVNINTMPLEFLLKRNSEKMDELITFPIYELENIALLTEMFFAKKDRECFYDIVSAVREFNQQLHSATLATDDIDKLNIYDSARRDFNKRYNASMSKMVEMLNTKLLGEWEYDLTKLRLKLFRRRRAG